MANIALTRKYSTMDDYWADVQTFMTSIGWLLHDDVDADNKVYKTNGSAGNYPYIYVKLTKSASYLYIILYLYWNEITHVGSVSAYCPSSYNYTSFTATYNMGLIGNADFITLINYTNSQGNTVGFCDELFYPEITTTTSGVVTGSYVDLPIVSSASFIPGQIVQIVGVDYEGRDKLTISSVADSTHITVVSLPRDYASGAFIGSSPCPAGATCGYSYKDRFYPLCDIDVVGDTNSPSSPYYAITFTISYSHVDPDETTGLYGLSTPYVVHSSYKLIGQFYGGGLIKYSSASTRWDIFAVVDVNNQPDQGTVTAVTTTTLVDDTKSWGTNALADRHVFIIADTGVGQSRKILSNTSDTLTVVEWDESPSTASTYKICDHIYRYWDRYFSFLQDREVL